MTRRDRKEGEAAEKKDEERSKIQQETELNIQKTRNKSSMRVRKMIKCTQRKQHFTHTRQHEKNRR